jgi:hypothetical protein
LGDLRFDQVVFLEGRRRKQCHPCVLKRSWEVLAVADVENRLEMVARL